MPASHNFQHATEIGACTHEHGRQNDDNASRKLNSLRSRSACTSWTQEVQAHPTLFLMVQSENSEPLLQQHCPETEVIPNTGPLAPWPHGPLAPWPAGPLAPYVPINNSSRIMKISAGMRPASSYTALNRLRYQANGRQPLSLFRTF